MATQNDKPDPHTSVPHDEENAAEAGGRAKTVDPSTSVPHDQPDPNTSVPHDVD